jgi:hypothetical protein
MEQAAHSQAAVTPERDGNLLSRLVGLWWESDYSTIPLARNYSLDEQAANERHLDLFLAILLQEARHPPRDEAGRLATRDRLFQAFEAMGRSSLGLNHTHLELFRSSGFMEAAANFVPEARRFDPQLQGQDIYQASRNAMLMHSLQMLMDQPVRLTPAILGYSLLYPYTDNYLDDASVPVGAKASFFERLVARLADPSLSPANSRERAVWALLGMIESQYDRSRYPQVFDSLMAIHRAQNHSVELVRPGASPYEVDVLGISLEKGGTSVVADGYLVAGDLTPHQQQFLFGLGSYLQFLDDLQDIQQDLQQGRLTLFSQTAGHWPLDGLTSRTLSFGLRVLEGVSGVDAARRVLEELLTKSTAWMILEAAGRAARFHTREYLGELQSHSPFRFATLNRQRKKLARQRIPLTRLLEAVLAAMLDQAVTQGGPAA